MLLEVEDILGRQKQLFTSEIQNYKYSNFLFDGEHCECGGVKTFNVFVFLSRGVNFDLAGISYSGR